MEVAMTTIWIYGQIPSGKNAIIITRTGHRFPQARFKKWRDDATSQLKHTLVGPASYHTPVRMTVSYTPSDLRRRDVPGMLDALCHLLEKTGVVADDALIMEVTWLRGTLDTPGVAITLEEDPAPVHVARLPKSPSPARSSKSSPRRGKKTPQNSQPT